MNRCKPQNLERGTPVQFGQQWVYHDHEPLKAMQDPAFWLNVARGEKNDRFRAGDTLRIVQTKREDGADVVEAYCDGTVIAIGAEGPHIQIDAEHAVGASGLSEYHALKKEAAALGIDTKGMKKDALKAAVEAAR